MVRFFFFSPFFEVFTFVLLFFVCVSRYLEMNLSVVRDEAHRLTIVYMTL